MLAAEKYDCWPKTTCGKDLQVMVPIKPDMTWDAAHDYTRDIAEQLAATARDRYVTSATIARAGRLFIHYLRNGRGTIGIGACPLRARPRFPIPAPATWQDTSDAFNLTKLPRSRRTHP
jgi:bifunctional non-homologous end joining protein LigD